MSAAPVVISAAAGADDLDHVRALFTGYQAELGVDLTFQGFAAELADLPGAYGPPAGRFLLARHGPDVAGGVGMRSLADGGCEMKRLYVRPPWRAGGLERRLAEAVVIEAEGAGYACMRLDSFPHLEAALALYRSMGFVDIAPYYANPFDDVVYLELRLRA